MQWYWKYIHTLLVVICNMYLGTYEHCLCLCNGFQITYSGMQKIIILIWFYFHCQSFYLSLYSKLDWRFEVGIILTKYWRAGGLPLGYIQTEMLNWNGGYTTSLLLIWSLSSFTDFCAAGSRIVIWISEYPISTLENLFLWRMSNKAICTDCL